MVQIYGISDDTLSDPNPPSASLQVTRQGVLYKQRNVAPVASIHSCHWLIRCSDTNSVGALLGDVGLWTRAFEAPVGILAVVEGHAVHAQHVSLQVALLGGTVGAVTALEWSLAWREEQNNRIL